MNFKFSFFVLIVFFLGCANKEIVSTDTTNDSKMQEVVDTPNEEEQLAINLAILEDKGYGPITSITLGDIDLVLVDEGEKAFNNNCKSCHDFDEKRIGPAMGGITKRRSPEWIMNIIINPVEMMKVNPAAKQLRGEYQVPMPNQNLDIDQVRAILEYLRYVDGSN